MNQSLEITSKIRFKDALRYNFYVAYSTTINRIFCVLSIISMVMFIYNMAQGVVSLDQRVTQSFPLLVAPFIFFIMIPIRVWKATGELINSEVLKDEVKYIFTNEKVVLNTSKGEADIQWDQYVRIVETKWDFRLFMDKVQAQIIPKYSLNQNEIKNLRNIIESAVDKRIIKLK